MGRKRGNAWRFFNEKKKGVSCKFCNKVYLHANVNKMKQHIITCVKCPPGTKKCLLVNNVEYSDQANNCSTNATEVAGPSTSDVDEMQCKFLIREIDENKLIF